MLTILIGLVYTAKEILFTKAMPLLEATGRCHYIHWTLPYSLQNLFTLVLHMKNAPVLNWLKAVLFKVLCSFAKNNNNNEIKLQITTHSTTHADLNN